MVEEKSRLGKLTCCNRCLGWVTADIAIFCPMCGKRVYPVVAPPTQWAGEAEAAAVRRKMEDSLCE